LFLIDAEFSASSTLDIRLERARPQVEASIAGAAKAALPT
jgi:hypothetical protein